MQVSAFAVSKNVGFVMKYVVESEFGPQRVLDQRWSGWIRGYGGRGSVLAYDWPVVPSRNSAENARLPKPAASPPPTPGPCLLQNIVLLHAA